MLDKGVQQTSPDTGWAHVASHDESAAVIDTILRLDPDETYTKTALSEAAGVPLKTLYLDGTLTELVALGLLEQYETDGEETVFAIDSDSAVFDAAKAFDEAVQARVEPEN